MPSPEFLTHVALLSRRARAEPWLPCVQGAALSEVLGSFCRRQVEQRQAGAGSSWWGPQEGCLQQSHVPGGVTGAVSVIGYPKQWYSSQEMWLGNSGRPSWLLPAQDVWSCGQAVSQDMVTRETASNGVPHVAAGCAWAAQEAPFLTSVLFHGLPSDVRAAMAPRSEREIG